MDALRIGDVFLIPLTIAEGIAPKGGQDVRYKFFVVLGFDDLGRVYGGVVINSQINHRLPQSITDYYMPISPSVYPFLRHKSFVNCSQLKETTEAKLRANRKVGSLRIEDCELVLATIISSPNENKARLRRFGLLKDTASERL